MSWPWTFSPRIWRPSNGRLMSGHHSASVRILTSTGLPLPISDIRFQWDSMVRTARTSPPRQGFSQAPAPARRLYQSQVLWFCWAQPLQAIDSAAAVDRIPTSAARQWSVHRRADSEPSALLCQQRAVDTPGSKRQVRVERARSPAPEVRPNCWPAGAPGFGSVATASASRPTIATCRTRTFPNES